MQICVILCNVWSHFTLERDLAIVLQSNSVLEKCYILQIRKDSSINIQMKRLQSKNKFRKLDIPSIKIRNYVTTRGQKIWESLSDLSWRNKKKIFSLKIPWVVDSSQKPNSIGYKDDGCMYSQMCSPSRATGRPWSDTVELYWKLEGEGVCWCRLHRSTEQAEKVRWLCEETMENKLLNACVMVSSTCRKNGHTVSLTGEI